jgi:hypothetical protein
MPLPNLRLDLLGTKATPLEIETKVGEKKWVSSLGRMKTANSLWLMQ